MFESDDYDQLLSQFVFPDAQIDEIHATKESNEPKNIECTLSTVNNITRSLLSNNETENKIDNESKVSLRNQNPNHILLPKHNKRKVIDTHFDCKSKRKFPGPAGLLTGTLEESKDENVSHIELLSQDVDFSQGYFKNSIFESPLWIKLLDDVKNFNLGQLHSINTIKQQALAGNLRRRKAQTVLACIESVDRSVTNPLISLRDKTGSIKCTLHRDAWTAFSIYIASEQCFLVLNKPTVLTTGTTYKKHYLNITLGNIFALYSTTVIKDSDEKSLPNGYTKTEDEFTIIKSTGNSAGLNLQADTSSENFELLDDLDSIFSDEQF